MDQSPRVPASEAFRTVPLIVGAWQYSEGHHRNGPGRADALEELLEVIAYGATTFDCADIYTGVEALLGETLRQARARMGDEVADALRVHTKLVPDRSSLATVDRRYVERVVDRSLARLGVERLDLVQFSWWDYGVERWVEVAGWLDEQRRAGKVAAVGATNFDTPALRALVEAGIPIAAHQVQYSLLDRRPAGAMAPWARAAGVPLLCYGALAGGFLTDVWRGRSDPAPGGLTDALGLPNRSLTKYRLVLEDFGGWGAYQALLEALAGVASDLGATTAQVALRWVLDRPAVGAVIVGMSRPARVRECLAALRLQVDAARWEPVERILEGAQGPAGDCFGLERDPESPHARIMRYDLNRVETADGAGG
ncbi:MAG: aldo/keto reductase [Gemmatimonadetes bacterium]|nr:aldo/keto reductase [Gemmatimonadota bacterium]